MYAFNISLSFVRSLGNVYTKSKTRYPDLEYTSNIRRISAEILSLQGKSGYPADIRNPDVGFCGQK